MNLVDSYIKENGYDYGYFGNAAEDTLVFFVRDEEAPYVEPSSGTGREAVTNDSDETVNGISGSTSETSAVNGETYAGIYAENGGENVKSNDTSDNKSDDEPVAGSAVPDANTYDDEFSQPMPPMAQKDEKQTEVGPSNRETGMNG